MAGSWIGGLRRLAAGRVIIGGVILRPIVEALAAIAAAYQLFATVACLSFRKVSDPSAPGPPASILKPVSGADSALRAALESHSNLVGEYELLCGVRSPEDPAVAVLREFPRAQVIECRTSAKNGKVGTLIDLVRASASRLWW